MSDNRVIYEQPLNELVRACLRLEHLFKQLDICLSSPNVDIHTQTIVRLIIDVLNLLDRPDLKAKLTKEFNRFSANFSRLQKLPEISHDTLSKILDQLTYLLTHFLNTPGKIGQVLRDNEFIANLRQNFMSPGGDSCIDAPAYFYWLNQSTRAHQQQIKEWLIQFKEIRQAIELLLNIMRNCSEPKKLIAEKGFYHEAMDSQSPLQLIRVNLSKTVKIFPEISAGRHRMSIRFVIPNLDFRPRQTPENIRFELTICVI